MVAELVEHDVFDLAEQPLVKLRAVETYLNARVLEHEALNHGLMLALVAEQHLCAVSAPGEAKSFTLELLEEVTDLNTLNIQLGPTMTFAALKGLPSVASLRDKDLYEYRTDVMCWNKQLVCLDEWQRVNDAFRDEALQWLAQRTLANGDVKVRTPLRTVLGASNSLPDPTDAFYDRFLLRYHLHDLSRDGFEQLLGQSYGATRAVVSEPERLSLADFTALTAAARAVVLPPDLIRTIGTIVYELKEKGVFISPRRGREALQLVQAQALLAGNRVIDEDDLTILRHCLWGKPEEQPLVAQVLAEYAAGTFTAAQELYDQTSALIDIARKDIPELRRKSGMPAAMKSFGEEVEKIEQAERKLAEMAQQTLAKHKPVERIQRLQERLLSQKEALASAVTLSR